MFKKSKKVTSLFLVCTMVAALMAGCGKKEESASSNNTSSNTTSTNKTDSSSKTESKEEKKEYPTVSFMAIDFNSGMSNVGNNAEEILTKIKDYTETNVDIQWTPSDVLEEKTTLALASPSNMPMIMTFNGAVNGTVVSAAKAGAFVDLTEYIKDSTKYPNLSKANAQVNQSLTVDGKLIGIYRARVIGRYGISYRADWAEKLGLSEPKTIDDVYNMLYAFTYNDPDGNGANDTIGMEMTSYTGPFDIMQTWFGVGNGWAEVDGKLVPVHMQDEYLEALNWFKKLYDDGLMPSDWAVRTTDTWSNGCKNGENGMYIDVLDGGRRIWDYLVTNDVKSVVDNTQLASMNLVGTINDRTMATSGYNGYFTLSASTCDTEEKIEAALHFLDKMCDDEMILLTGYGLEGINYDINEKGYVVRKDTGDDALKANYAGLNQLVAYIPNTVQTSPTEEKTDRLVLEEKVKDENVKYAVFNEALAYLVNSATYSELGSTLDEIITQARSQYICGQIDEAGLRSAWQSWLDQGGQKIIDEVNEQYQASK